jgi:ATP-dependent protease ClpP protease subunit
MFNANFVRQCIHLLAAFSALIAGMQSAHAIQIQRVDTDVFISGDIVANDDIKLRAEMEAAPVKRLILVNSRGGHLFASMKIARWLTTQSVTTLVAGPCLSACSLIFMAGQQRQYATGYEPRLTVVGIHGPSMPFTGQLLPAHAADMLAFYKERMGDKYDAEMLRMALFELKDASGFMLIREISRNQPRDRVTLLCPTSSTPRWRCTEYPRQDAYSLGLVTSTETVALDLPEEMRPRMP